MIKHPDLIFQKVGKNLISEEEFLPLQANEHPQSKRQEIKKTASTRDEEFVWLEWDELYHSPPDVDCPKFHAKSCQSVAPIDCLLVPKSIAEKITQNKANCY